MDKRFIAIYENEKEATEAVEHLKQQGYTTDQISIIAKNIDKLPNEAEEVSPTRTDGFVAGAAAGGAVGLTGLLIGLSALAVPGIGPILAAGPIFATFGGAAAGAASGAGGLRKPLLDMGLEEEEVDQYVEDIKAGKILVIADPVLSE
ncbi:general stress protein [Peribacillus muralis]|uniref:general stress protein n=1 Tax=Peribacillus muralis TaxID=264697 RepID=UPI00070DAF98|nr:general stress protein [Peribacillus muralis]MCK1991239.1 general stress protein [Peribacillus muralis]MCK2011793.1 general stress protein [Peribacillus muralis]